MPHSKSRNKSWKAQQLQRKAKAMHKDNAEFEQDTAHAMSQPSQLTPLQLMRLERSAQRLLARREKKQTKPTLKELNKMSSSEFLKATQGERSH